MIRTTDQLISKIADDLIWRRKELTELKAMIQSADGKIKQRVLIRSAVALLYAHWEGFVKKSAAYYLEFVASHRLPHGRLAPNFIGLILRAKYQELSVTDKISGASELSDFFCTALLQQSNVPYKNVVDTKSNLSSKVLIDILNALGLSDKHFETRLKFIDGNLVNPRNYIAHGEVLDISVPDYFELHEAVLTLIETFRNEIENASVMKQYERKIDS